MGTTQHNTERRITYENFQSKKNYGNNNNNKKEKLITSKKKKKRVMLTVVWVIRMISVVVVVMYWWWRWWLLEATNDMDYCQIVLPTGCAPWLAVLSGVSSEHLSHGISFEFCDDDDDVDDDTNVRVLGEFQKIAAHHHEESPYK